MSVIDWISDIIVSTQDNNEDCPEQFIDFKLGVSWRHEYFSITASTDEGQRPLSFEQIEIDTSDYNDKHNFIEKMTAELKKIAFLHLNIAMTFVDLDSPEIVFTCQSCDSLVQKAMDIYNLSYNEIMRLNITQDDHHAEILFFIQEKQTESMIFTSGYHNIVASQDLYLEILQLNPEPENLYFLGVIEGDDRKKVKKCTKIASKAVKERLKASLEGSESVKNIKKMTIEEIQETFFENREKKKKKRASEIPEAENAFRRIMPSRKAKRETVDLTLDELEEEQEEVRKDLKTSSVTSGDFWEICGSEGDMDWEDCDVKVVMSKFEVFELFLKNLDLGEDDKEYQEMMLDSVETMEETKKEYEERVEKDQQRFDKEKEIRWKKEEEAREAERAQWRKDREKFNYEEWIEIEHLRKEKPKPKPEPCPWFPSDRPSSSQFPKSTRTSIGAPKSTKPSFSSPKYAMPSSSSPFVRSLFDHHNDKLTDPSTSPLALPLGSPQLGRGLNPNEKVTFEGPPIKKSRHSLLFADDELEDHDDKVAERLKREHEAKIRKFKEQTPSSQPSQSDQTTSSYKIPKKSRSPDRKPSGSLLASSPVSSIQGRRPINNRSFEPLNRGAHCLELVRKNREKVNLKQLDKNMQTLHVSNNNYSPREIAVPLGRNHAPASIASFIDGEKPPEPSEVIELDSDNDDENNNNTKRTRKLQPLTSPQKHYSIFKSKNERRSKR